MGENSENNTSGQMEMFQIEPVPVPPEQQPLNYLSRLLERHPYDEYLSEVNSEVCVIVFSAYERLTSDKQYTSSPRSDEPNKHQPQIYRDVSRYYLELSQQHVDREIPSINRIPRHILANALNVIEEDLQPKQ